VGGLGGGFRSCGGDLSNCLAQFGGAGRASRGGARAILLGRNFYKLKLIRAVIRRSFRISISQVKKNR
jgi:hypothetical protein